MTPADSLSQITTFQYSNKWSFGCHAIKDLSLNFKLTSLKVQLAKVAALRKTVLGWAYRGLTGGFLWLQNFSVAISVSPHVCFILVLILISMFLR